MKLKNLFLALKYQLPLSRAFRNFFITRNAWGMFHRNSHFRQDINVPKVTYTTYKSANKACVSMEKKYEGKFRAYKCVFCDGFHIGKNKV